MNDELILQSIKKLLNIPNDHKAFDQDIIIHINSIFSILYQMGVGPKDKAFVANEFSTWDEFMQDKTNINDVKTYIYLRVRLLFDPPTSGTVMEACRQEISELAFRLNLEDDDTVDYSKDTSNVDDKEVNWGD